MPDAILSISHLSRSFGRVAAVRDLSLAVAPGEIYGLVGPDGAGKTTTLRLVCAAYRPDAGSVSISGYALNRQPEQARAQVGYLSQHFSLYEELTVLENIRFLAEARGLAPGDWLKRSMDNLEFVGLGAFQDRLAGKLSGGMKQKLSLACALVNRPRLLLLDEPTTGVDPVTRQDFWQLIIRLAGEQGLAVLVCTPYMDEASRCSRVGFMRGGQLIVEGSPRELRQMLRGRVLELSGAPEELLAQAARSDPDVQNVQRFGDRLHLRIADGQSETVQERLPQSARALGGQVELLEEIEPLLEDVFIDLAEANQLAGPEMARVTIPAVYQSSTSANGQAVSAVISVDNLTRRFDDFVAVDHLSFDVQPGQIIGYLGPNGSGKTTTIRMLLGLLRPSEGRARVLGFDSARNSADVRARTGYMSQKFALYDELTALENLAFYAGVYGVRDRKRVYEVIDSLGLALYARQLVRTLSGGWRQRLALAVAIVHRPQLLLLDEPTSGVDPTARRAFWDMIYTLSADGITILVTTHYMDEAEYCGQVGILNNGRLLAIETPNRLKQGLPGRMWEVVLEDTPTGEAAPLLPALDCLASQPGVRRASLAGDHLRALTAPDVSEADLLRYLESAAIQGARVSAAQPVMEDVFMSLVGK